MYCSREYQLTSRRVGGLALITKKDFKVKLVSNAELSTFQFEKWNVQLMQTTVTILGIYLPSAESPVEFPTETNLLVAGDFNLHISNEDDENAVYGSIGFYTTCY